MELPETSVIEEDPTVTPMGSLQREGEVWFNLPHAAGKDRGDNSRKLLSSTILSYSLIG